MLIDVVFDMDGNYRALLVLSEHKTEFIELGDIIFDWSISLQLALAIKETYNCESLNLSPQLEEFLATQEYFDEGITPFYISTAGKLIEITDDFFMDKIHKIVLGKKNWKKASQLKKYLDQFEECTEIKEKIKGKSLSDIENPFNEN